MRIKRADYFNDQERVSSITISLQFDSKNNLIKFAEKVEEMAKNTELSFIVGNIDSLKFSPNQEKTSTLEYTLTLYGNAFVHGESLLQQAEKIMEALRRNFIIPKDIAEERFTNTWKKQP